jgi:hypothetical protein
MSDRMRLQRSFTRIWWQLKQLSASFGVTSAQWTLSRATVADTTSLEV